MRRLLVTRLTLYLAEGWRLYIGSDTKTELKMDMKIRMRMGISWMRAAKLGAPSLVSSPLAPVRYGHYQVLK